jgi:hypothetical protein
MKTGCRRRTASPIGVSRSAENAFQSRSTFDPNPSVAAISNVRPSPLSSAITPAEAPSASRPCPSTTSATEAMRGAPDSWAETSCNRSLRPRSATQSAMSWKTTAAPVVAPSPFLTGKAFTS